MAIKLWGNTNIALTNTSFVGDVYPGKKSVPLFTAASNWTYYFEWDIQDSGTIAVSLNINSTPKEIWTYYDSVSHHVSYEFTLVIWDVVEIEVSWYWTGSNLTVTRYVDEPKEIFVWEWIDSYEAMRWPCPEGYHVPTWNEFSAVFNCLETLWAWARLTWSRDYLLIPYIYKRRWKWTWEVENSSSIFLWTSEMTNNTVSPSYIRNKALAQVTSSGNGIRGSYIESSYWCQIRPFKNIPVIPNSSWTTLYDGSSTATSAWIFHNITEWLISISKDWVTWYTLYDKNLWATKYYWQSWATENEIIWNCYQWWNNYWFSMQWNVTTSATQVDASTYWPWNYYSSNTFITNSWNWDSSSNNNLRWRNVKKWNVKEVYVGTTKVRPPETVLFDYWDWTNSQWTTTGKQWTITRTSSYISFYGSGFSQNELSEYEIDFTKNFLFEFRADIPNTTASSHRVSLWIASFGTSWESNRRNKIWGVVNNTDYGWDTNNWPRDFFFRWENGTFTIWWDGVTKWTGTYTLTGQESPYLREQVYKNTLTIYTAKLTYL